MAPLPGNHPSPPETHALAESDAWLAPYAHLPIFLQGLAICEYGPPYLLIYLNDFVGHSREHYLSFSCDDNNNSPLHLAFKHRDLSWPDIFKIIDKLNEKNCLSQLNNHVNKDGDTALDILLKFAVAHADESLILLIEFIEIHLPGTVIPKLRKSRQGLSLLHRLLVGDNQLTCDEITGIASCLLHNSLREGATAAIDLFCQPLLIDDDIKPEPQARDTRHLVRVAIESAHATMGTVITWCSHLSPNRNQNTHLLWWLFDEVEREVKASMQQGIFGRILAQLFNTTSALIDYASLLDTDPALFYRVYDYVNRRFGVLPAALYTQPTQYHKLPLMMLIYNKQLATIQQNRYWPFVELINSKNRTSKTPELTAFLEEIKPYVVFDAKTKKAVYISDINAFTERLKHYKLVEISNESSQGDAAPENCLTVQTLFEESSLAINDKLQSGVMNVSAPYVEGLLRLLEQDYRAEIPADESTHAEQKKLPEHFDERPINSLIEISLQVGTGLCYDTFLLQQQILATRQRLIRRELPIDKQQDVFAEMAVPLLPKDCTGYASCLFLMMDNNNIIRCDSSQRVQLLNGFLLGIDTVHHQLRKEVKDMKYDIFYPNLAFSCGNSHNQDASKLTHLFDTPQLSETTVEICHPDRGRTLSGPKTFAAAWACLRYCILCEFPLIWRTSPDILAEVVVSLNRNMPLRKHHVEITREKINVVINVYSREHRQNSKENRERALNQLHTALVILLLEDNLSKIGLVCLDYLCLIILLMQQADPAAYEKYVQDCMGNRNSIFDFNDARTILVAVHAQSADLTQASKYCALLEKIQPPRPPAALPPVSSSVLSPALAPASPPALSPAPPPTTPAVTNTISSTARIQAQLVEPKSIDKNPSQLDSLCQLIRHIYRPVGLTPARRADLTVLEDNYFYITLLQLFLCEPDDTTTLTWYYAHYIACIDNEMHVTPTAKQPGLQLRKKWLEAMKTVPGSCEAMLTEFISDPKNSPISWKLSSSKLSSTFHHQLTQISGILPRQAGKIMTLETNQARAICGDICEKLAIIEQTLLNQKYPEQMQRLIIEAKELAPTPKSARAFLEEINVILQIVNPTEPIHSVDVDFTIAEQIASPGVVDMITQFHRHLLSATHPQHDWISKQTRAPMRELSDKQKRTLEDIDPTLFRL